MNVSKESAKNRDSSFDGAYVTPFERVKRTLETISKSLAISNISLKRGGQPDKPSYGFQFSFWSRSTYKVPYQWRQVTASPGYENNPLGDIRYPGKGDSGTVALFEYKARELADKLKTFRKDDFSDKAVDDFWLWIDQVFSGKQSVVEPDSPLMADVVAKLKAAKGGFTTWKSVYLKNLPDYAADTRLLACLEQLPAIFTKADGKGSRANAVTCWRAIAGLPGVKGNLTAQKILDFIENQVEHDLSPKVERKTRVPSDLEIFRVWEIGFDPERWLSYEQPHKGSKKGYLTRCRPESCEVSKQARWAFLMLAAYGLRIHELSHVANWASPVTLQDGDWVSFTFNDELSNGDDEDDGKNDKVTDWRQQSVTRVIPAWNDPTVPNHKRFLAIKSDTKTGWRIAAPLSPVGSDWVQLLLDTAEEMDAEWGYLPYSEDGHSKHGGNNGQNKFTNRLGHFISGGKRAKAINENRILWEKVYGDDDWESLKFSAHKLRHAFVHRARAQGYSFAEISELTGHQEETCRKVYYQHVADENAMAAKLLSAEKFSDKLNRPDSPTISLESAIAVASSLMDGSCDDKLITLLSAIYGLKADELPINR